MLPRAYRLKKQAEFARVLQGGRKVRIGNLLFFFTPADQPQPRLGIVLSKKVAKKATDRNHIRRVISHIAAPLLKAWGNRPVGDMAVIVLGVPENLFDSLKHDFDQWLKKLSSD